MSVKQIIKRGLTYIIKGTPIKKTVSEISYLSPSETLKGKKIIITGGGSGLGLAMAKKFIQEKAEVLIVGRNEKKLQDAAQKLGCKYLQLDVTDCHSFKTFMENAAKELGGINVLVSNAGVSLHENSFFEVTPESFDIQINTNFKGPFFLAQQFISYLKETHQKGNILFVSSETGATVDCRPYGYTKAAINSMTKGLAHLFAKDGIRINAIAPGITASDMTGLSSEGNIYFPGNIIERVYMPEEVAETACFLISDAAGCISGEIITCNNAKTVNPRWK